jgi:glycosyltransferase 2 family protein
MLRQLRGRLLIGLLIGVVVVAAVVVLSDASALARALEDFNWWLLPLVLALSLGNYALRFVKWQYYLHLLGVTTLSRRDSLLIFVAGFTMAMTPGKVGELLKAYLVRVRTGTPLARTAPVIAAERVTDGCAMLGLAIVGLTTYRHGWPVLLVSAALAVSAIVLVQRESLMLRLIDRMARTRLGRGRGEALQTLYVSTRILLRPRPFVFATALGMLSWFGECLALCLVLVGLGLPFSVGLLLASTFVFSVAAWIGALSLLPGGLGAAEASVAGLLLLTVNDPLMSAALAGTATLIIRFATLWFGVLLGVLALGRVTRWTSSDHALDSPPIAHSLTG